MQKNAIILSIGSELTRGEIIDLNSSYIANRLTEIGINILKINLLPDNLDLIVEEIKKSFEKTDILILAGGLGPTDDDLTRKAFAKAFNIKLIKNDQEEKRIKNIFKERSIFFVKDNIRQCYFPENSEILINKKGTASGFKVIVSDKLLYVIPGVPHEAKYLFDEFILKELKKNFSTNYFKFIIKTHDITESALNEKFKKIKISDIEWGTLSNDDGIHLYVILRDNLSQENINNIKNKIIKNFEKYIWGVDNETLPQLIGEILKNKNLSLCVAESCTGGLIGKLITDIPGSSSYFRGGAIAYDNSIKNTILGVNEKIIKKYGAVSKEVVEMMAINSKKVFDADCSIAVSGIAGPGGGSKEKPVGLVWMCISTPFSLKTFSRIFTGERNFIRLRTAYYSLGFLKSELILKN